MYYLVHLSGIALFGSKSIKKLHVPHDKRCFPNFGWHIVGLEARLINSILEIILRLTITNNI